MHPDRSSQHEHIAHIGNSAANWKLTRESAIERINSKQEAFYTIDKSTGRKVYVGVPGWRLNFDHMIAALLDHLAGHPDGTLGG